MSILVVEDEQTLATSICQYLESSQYQCDVAGDYNTALAKIEVHDYDCILLDIELPGGSGLKLLAALKEDRKTEGVLIISARNGVDDKVEGLQLGADDYLAKPFHLSELRARMEAIIRRKSFDGATTLDFDLLTLNFQQKTVRIDGKALELTRKEYELLLYFISNRNKVISKSAIADHLWGEVEGANGNYDFIYTHIKNLRRKLMLAGSPDYIYSVYGMGYKLRIP